MKNYYDLNKAERTKYLKEFKKTPVGKDMNLKLIRSFVLMIVYFCILCVLIYFVDDLETVSYETNIFINAISALTIFTAIFSFLYSAYLNLNFTSWLKNKYEIKRW